MLALDADLIGAKGSQTAVTVATDTHANGLLDSFDLVQAVAGRDVAGEPVARRVVVVVVVVEVVVVRGRPGRRGSEASSRAGDPFAWLEGEAVLRKEGAGAFLLHRSPLARSWRLSLTLTLTWRRRGCCWVCGEVCVCGSSSSRASSQLWSTQHISITK